MNLSILQLLDVWHVPNTSSRNGLLGRMQSQKHLVSAIQCLPLIFIAGVEFPCSSFQRDVMVQGAVCTVSWECFCCEFPENHWDRTVLHPGLGLDILQHPWVRSWKVMWCSVLGYCGAALRVRAGRMASNSSMKPVLCCWISAIMSFSASSPVFISPSMIVPVLSCPLTFTLLYFQSLASFLFIFYVHQVIE